MLHLEGRPLEQVVGGDPRGDVARVGPAQIGDRDMGRIVAGFRLQACPTRRGLAPGGQTRQRFGRLDTGPDGPNPIRLAKRPGALERDRKGRHDGPFKFTRQILGHRFGDLAEEPQGDVQGFHGSPTGAFDAALDQVEGLASLGRNGDCCEKSDHDADRFGGVLAHSRRITDIEEASVLDA